MIMLTETVTYTCVTESLTNTFLASFDLLKETSTWAQVKNWQFGNSAPINYFPNVWINVTNNGEANVLAKVGVDDLNGNHATYSASNLCRVAAISTTAANDDISVAHSGGSTLFLASANAATTTNDQARSFLAPRINVYGTSANIDPAPIEGHTIVITCYMIG